VDVAEHLDCIQLVVVVAVIIVVVFRSRHRAALVVTVAHFVTGAVDRRQGHTTVAEAHRLAPVEAAAEQSIDVLVLVAAPATAEADC
jgi:hypothetical protein